MMPLVGFLPPDDPRVVSTVEAIGRELMVDGFVLRYRTTDDGSLDGLQGREGAFLACSFWYVDCLHMIGRTDDARAMFERLIALCNDLGLLSEEYDPVAGRLVGNFPQAFSHVSLVNSACRLTEQQTLSPGQGQVATRIRNLMTQNLAASFGPTARSHARWRFAARARQKQLARPADVHPMQRHDEAMVSSAGGGDVLAPGADGDTVRASGADGDTGVAQDADSNTVPAHDAVGDTGVAHDAVGDNGGAPDADTNSVPAHDAEEGQ
jgi:hypothetical protein